MQFPNLGFNRGALAGWRRRGGALIKCRQIFPLLLELAAQIVGESAEALDFICVVLDLLLEVVGGLGRQGYSGLDALAQGPFARGPSSLMTRSAAVS